MEELRGEFIPESFIYSAASSFLTHPRRMALLYMWWGKKGRLINLSEIFGDAIIKNLYLHQQKIQEAGTSTLWLREQRRELPH